MKLGIVLGLLLIGGTVYDYTRPVTCRVSKDISIGGDLGLYKKCQTPWGVYYKETLLRYVSY